MERWEDREDFDAREVEGDCVVRAKTGGADRTTREDDFGFGANVRDFARVGRVMEFDPDARL